nr:MAG TPA: hypothetical protein [Caudoviricetes sp.]
MLLGQASDRWRRRARSGLPERRGAGPGGEGRRRVRRRWPHVLGGRRRGAEAQALPGRGVHPHPDAGGGRAPPRPSPRQQQPEPQGRCDLPRRRPLPLLRPRGPLDGPPGVRHGDPGPPRPQ